MLSVIPFWAISSVFSTIWLTFSVSHLTSLLIVYFKMQKFTYKTACDFAGAYLARGTVYFNFISARFWAISSRVGV